MRFGKRSLFGHRPLRHLLVLKIPFNIELNSLVLLLTEMVSYKPIADSTARRFGVHILGWWEL